MRLVVLTLAAFALLPHAIVGLAGSCVLVLVAMGRL